LDQLDIVWALDVDEWTAGYPALDKHLNGLRQMNHIHVVFVLYAAETA